MQRLFIALSLSPGVRKNLRALQRELEPKVPGMRWLAEDTFHVTLKFIGEVPVEEVDPMCRLAIAAAEGIEAFEFQLTGLGVFPSTKSPKVLWAGVAADDSHPIREIAARIDQAAAEYGIRSEGRFTPHVTLARSATRATGSGGMNPAEWDDLLAHYQRYDIAKVFVRDIVTYNSSLAKGGATYEVLATAPLG